MIFYCAFVYYKYTSKRDITNISRKAEISTASFFCWMYGYGCMISFVYFCFMGPVDGCSIQLKHVAF